MIRTNTPAPHADIPLQRFPVMLDHSVMPYDREAL
jgi:hypothetical protein